MEHKKLTGYLPIDKLWQRHYSKKVFIINTAFKEANIQEQSKCDLYPINKDNLWGYANKDGDIIISFQYQFADEFSEGLAAVRKGGNWGYIDTAGNTCIPFEFSGASMFVNNKAAVYKNELWGFIDKTGKVVIDYQYKDIQLVHEEFGWVYYDEKGNPIN